MSENRNTNEFEAFLSYARVDDERDNGRITALRRDLSDEVAMQMGFEFPIFQDLDDIFTGQRWKNRIHSVIDGTTFLIPIITPSFFNSQMCMDEVRQFIQREQKLNRDDLIIPILYLPTPELENSENEIAQNLSSRQYYPWGDLRFKDTDSNEYRRAVAELAEQIVSAIERSKGSGQQPIVAVENQTYDESDADTSSGFLELIAEAEEAMPLFVQTTLEFAEKLNEFSEASVAATSEIEFANRSGKPASARLVAVRRFTKRLDSPTKEMEILADEYIDQLMRVGSGIDALIAQLSHTSDEEDMEAARELVATLAGLLTEAENGMASLMELHEAISPMYNLSSTLRPVLRRISGAINKLVPSVEVFRSWHDGLAVAIERKS